MKLINNLIVGGAFILLLVLVFTPVFLEHQFYKFLLTYSEPKAAESFTQYIPSQIYRNPYRLKTDVLVVGSSDIREFFPHNDALDTLFDEGCEQNITPFNAATSSQSLSDTFAVLNAAFETGIRPELILIGLSEGRLLLDNHTPEKSLSRSRVVLPHSPEIVSEMTPLGYTARKFATLSDAIKLWMYGNSVEQLKAYNSYELRSLNRNYYASPGIELIPKDQRLSYDSKIYAQKFADNALTNASRYVHYLEKMALDKGIRIVFIYTPRAKSAWPYLKLSEPIRQQALKVFMNSPFELTDLQYYKHLEESHFYDSSHLVEEGRVAFWSGAGGSELMRDLCDTF